TARAVVEKLASVSWHAFELCPTAFWTADYRIEVHSFLLLLLTYPFGTDGYPALVVAVVNALTLVLVSSNVTIAVLSLSDTSALDTPGTRRRLFFTIKGQSAQYIFLTVNETVLSPAKLTDEAINPNTNTTGAMSIFTALSVHELKSKGATKSIPRATATSTVATMRPAFTIQFGHGVEQTASSTQAAPEER